jgi:two-component system, cell cycle sensor histidine kinase and response regulator CckA
MEASLESAVVAVARGSSIASSTTADAVVRVLLVEDDEEDCLLTRKLLGAAERATFELTWAASYDEALNALRSPCDVCLVDYHLGADSGLALIKRAIADGYRGPMILLTGRGDHQVDVEAMRAGAADYLVKGEITAELLERVIRHAIERRRADKALRESEEHLRHARKMEAIGSLAWGVAHDFNNLLSVILGYTELVVKELHPGDPMRADLDEVHTAGLRAAELTRQLLAFGRQQVLRPRIVDLNAVCTGMEKMLRRVIGEDVELTSLAAPALLPILADPGQMEQVLMNLAANARDAMAGGGKLTIETTNVVFDEREAAEHAGMKAGPHVLLTVNDTGAGMDKETLAHMFEPFFTTKEIGKGTGLGLSTVFGIVKQSGGSIRASSEPGKGTTIRIYFPATDAPAAAVESAPERAERIDRRALRGSETILLVEDEERVRILARTILRKYGYQVLDAQSGGYALIVCEQHPGVIDLLVADVVLPRMSGPQLAARLALTRPDMKVLYMTGYAGASMLQHGPFAALLEKPFTPDTLAAHVHDLLCSPRTVGTVGAVADLSSDRTPAPVTALSSRLAKG